MKKLTFKELAKKVLEETNKPMTPEEIWDYAIERGYDRLLRTQGKTPWRTLGAQFYVDIRDNPNTPFKIVSKNPTLFGLKGRQYSLNNTPIIKEKKDKYHERDLHPVLTYYFRTRFKGYTKTIYHEKSKNRKKNYSKWLHPDMVGVQYFFQEWEDNVKNVLLDLSRYSRELPFKLFSFEIKKKISFDNLRESFFQAVSNSSWAHEGYLVISELEQDEDLYNELKRLSSSFGIGVIVLDISSPDNSYVMYKAKENEYLDLDTMSRLLEENPDFRQFLKTVSDDLKIKSVHKDRYDKLENIEDLMEKFKHYIKII